MSREVHLFPTTDMTPPESARTQLLVPECHHRINSRGAAGGDVARDQSDNGPKQPDRGKRNHIGLTDAKELRFKQAREC